MHLSRMLIGLAAGSLLAVGLVGTAEAAPPISVTLSKISGGDNTAIVKAVCPVDPPQTLYMNTESELIGSMSVTCTGKPQKFVLPLTVDVLTGGTLQEVGVTIGGEGGDVGNFYEFFEVTR